MAELRSPHPFMILDIAQRVALRTAVLIENLAMTVNLNFYVARMQMQALEGDETKLGAGEELYEGLQSTG